jgi:hypothetical protein
MPSIWNVGLPELTLVLAREKWNSGIMIKSRICSIDVFSIHDSFIAWIMTFFKRRK